MLKLLADENFDGDITRGLQRRVVGLDLVRVQDNGLMAADDIMILNWACKENRILLTHDAKTIPMYFYDRVKNGVPSPGVIIIKSQLPIGGVIDSLRLLIEFSNHEELHNQIIYLQI